MQSHAVPLIERATDYPALSFAARSSDFFGSLEDVRFRQLTFYGCDTLKTMGKPPFGFWTIQALNISLCAIPKGGSTMNMQLLVKAMSTPTKNKCTVDWSRVAAQLRKRGVEQQYSPNTTNIVIVRDPWTRAVSSFNDQIVRKHIPSNRSHEAFMHYLNHHAKKEFTHHTGTVATKCIGYPSARFDHIINLEDISSFARVARLVPAYGRLIETGWEECTNGDPRLYIKGSVALHKNEDKDMSSRLCTREAIAKVCEVYKADYTVLARIGHPFSCSCKADVGLS